MTFNLKNSVTLKEVCSELEITPLDAIELIGRHDLTLWTHYESHWIKLNTQDLNHITTKATKVFKLEGTYKTSRGKKVQISTFLDFGETRDDKSRPIEALRLDQKDSTALLGGERNASQSMRTPSISSGSAKSDTKNTGKHWNAKREAIQSAVIFQIQMALSEDDKSVFKTQNGKRSLNKSKIAQRVVDFSTSMTQTKDFADQVSHERVMDVLRDATNI